MRSGASLKRHNRRARADGRANRLDAFAIAAILRRARLATRRQVRGPGVAPSSPLAGAFAVCFAASAPPAPLILPRIAKCRSRRIGATSGRPHVRDQHLKGTVLIWLTGASSNLAVRPDSVSMDGRRETVYSQAGRRAPAFLPREPAYADELHADYVWLPSALRVVRELQHNSWRVACEEPTSVLLLHAARCHPRRASVGPPQTTPPLSASLTSPIVVSGMARSTPTK
jgi:hypothetical protein